MVPCGRLIDNRACSQAIFAALLGKFPEPAHGTRFFKAAPGCHNRCLGRTIGWSGCASALAFGELVGVPQDKTIEPRQAVSSKLAVLRRHPIFCDLDAEAFEQLCRYAKNATLKRGATIYSKGDPGNSLYVVISGTAKMSISSPDGRSAILNLIGPGEIFGEIALLDGRERTADATANTNCEVFIIDRREFLPFVRSQPALAMKFIELLCARLRWTSDQVEQIILQDLPGRLASALIRLTERHKATQGGRAIAITQQEISEMVGMSRESINKQLRAWASRNWVRLEHGAIIVLEAGPLQEIAGSGAEGD
jgi:CRP/FNR family cyclic AMP-dependent transcriptional regulator